MTNLSLRRISKLSPLPSTSNASLSFGSHHIPHGSHTSDLPSLEHSFVHPSFPSPNRKSYIVIPPSPKGPFFPVPFLFFGGKYVPRATSSLPHDYMRLIAYFSKYFLSSIAFATSSLSLCQNHVFLLLRSHRDTLFRSPFSPPRDSVSFFPFACRYEAFSSFPPRRTPTHIID